MLHAATGVLLATCVLGLCWCGVWVLVVRRRLIRDEAVFRCVVRVDRGPVAELGARPRATRCRAQWVHDVLLLHRGTWWPRTDGLPVRTTGGTIRLAVPADHARCGPIAVLLVLCLDGGARITVTAPVSEAEKLAGPFLAIAAAGAPPTVMPTQRPEDA